MYDIDEFFKNIHSMDIGLEYYDGTNLFTERRRTNSEDESMLQKLRYNIRGKVREIENYIDRYISRQSKTWKSNIEEWNKKFRQWGIKTKNIVEEEPPRIVKDYKDKSKQPINLTPSEDNNNFQDNRNLAIRYEMPAVFVIAYEPTTGYRKEPPSSWGMSGDPPTKNIEDIAKLSMDFRKCIDKVGKIGEKGPDLKNLIGRCAEFHAVYNILKEHKEVRFRRIKLSLALRVKYDNKKIVTKRYCDNCKKMFENTYILAKEHEGGKVYAL